MTQDLLPHSWELVPLATLLAAQGAGVWGSEVEDAERILSIVRNGDIGKDGSVRGSLPLRGLTRREAEKATLEPGDILITTSGDVGKCAIWPSNRPDCGISNFARRLRAGPGLYSKYLYYWLRTTSVQSQLDARARGITIRNLPSSVWDELRVPLAPLAEQHCIVAALEEHLSDLEAAVAGLTRTRTNITRYRQALIDAATKEGEPVQLATLLREPLRNGHSAPKAADGRGVRVFSISAVTEGDFSERNTKIAAMDPARVAALWAAPGDIFVQRSNTPELVGTARLYCGPERFAVFPDLLIRVRTNDAALPAYVALALRSTRVRQYYRATAQGIAGSMPKIDQGVVERTVIPLPSPCRQREIVDQVYARLAAADRTGAEVDTQLARAARLRQSILKYAFEGKLVPQDPSDEPASALLTRCREGTQASSTAKRARTRSSARRERS